MPLAPAVETWKATQGLKIRLETAVLTLFGSMTLWPQALGELGAGVPPHLSARWLSLALGLLLVILVFKTLAALDLAPPRVRLRLFLAAEPLLAAWWVLVCSVFCLTRARAPFTWHSGLVALLSLGALFLALRSSYRTWRSVSMPLSFAERRLVDDLDYRIKEGQGLLQSPRVLLLGPLSDEHIPPWLCSFDDGFLYVDGLGEVAILPRDGMAFPPVHPGQTGTVEVEVPIAGGSRRFSRVAAFELLRFRQRAGLQA
ncbi:MAG: hypothetical protein U0P81_07855 [Holophagaceae bacterium]